MTGYFNNEQANKDSFSGDWFRTGDVVVTDEDGDIFIVDRIKDMIKVRRFIERSPNVPKHDGEFSMSFAGERAAGLSNRVGRSVDQGSMASPSPIWPLITGAGGTRGERDRCGR